MARLLKDAVAKLPGDEAKDYFDSWAADLRARNILLNLAKGIYEGPGHSATNEAVASLVHAIDYLHDRIAYEMEPHPKGMILFPWEPSQ